MKPFLGINITDNKNNDQLNGTAFVTAKISEIQAAMLQQASERAENQQNKSQLPKPLRVLRWITMFASLCCISGIFNALGEDVSLAQGYQNAPVIFWIGGVCLVAWIALAVWGKRREKEVSESDETRRVLTTTDQLIQNSYAELSVPADAVNCDILMFRYVEKNGEILPRGMGPLTFIACDSKVFLANDCLCLADVHQRYEFPLAALRRIVTIQKDAGIPSWNKDVPYNQAPYKQYKLRADNYGFVHFKPYHILELEMEGETWGIYFPSYELPVMEELTGLQAQ